MCTCYCIDPISLDFGEMIEEAESSPLMRPFIDAGTPLVKAGEVRPTNVVPVIAPGKSGALKVFPMRWGFRIPGKSLIVNARTETAKSLPTFRDSWQKRRCIVPASWYFEWSHFTDPVTGKKKTGDKFMIQPEGSLMTWLCGLYRMEEGIPVFPVLPRQPTEKLALIHDRMTFMLPKEKINEWIDPGTDADNLLPYALTDLMIERIGSAQMEMSLSR